MLYACIVLASVAHLILRDQMGWIPTGLSGQPRSYAIPPDWTPPWQLTLFLCASQVILLAAPWRPAIGIATFVMLSFLFRVHSSSWIYSQGVGVQTITAILACLSVIVGCHSRTPVRELLNLPFVRWFTAFLAWCLVCGAVATFATGDYEPPLQFHPIRLLQAAALSASVILLGDRAKMLTLIARTLVITLLMRIALLDPVLFRDAGIASDVAMTCPLVGYLIVSADRWWKQVAFVVVVVGFSWLVFRVENRGALLGCAFGLLTAWWTTRRRALGLLVGLPTLVGFLFWFARTEFGTRLFDPERWALDKRPRLFRESVSMGIDHFLFGVGPGNFVNRIGEYAPRLEHYSSHNLFLNVLAETGIPGMFLFCVCLAVAIGAGYEQWRHDDCEVSRWALVTLAVSTGIGMFLTTTMFVLPYMVMTITQVAPPPDARTNHAS